MKPIKITWGYRDNIKNAFYIHHQEKEPDQDLLTVAKKDIPDSDRLIITEQLTGKRFKRVIIPENYFLFKRI